MIFLQMFHRMNQYFFIKALKFGNCDHDMCGQEVGVI